MLLKNKLPEAIAAKFNFYRQPIFWILLSTLFFQVFYLFKLSDYSHHLYSDMFGYWQRAQDRYQGQIIELNQWSVWPPFFHICLAESFKIIDFFRLTGYRLETTLLLFLLASLWGTYAVYNITRQLSDHIGLAHAAAIAHGFCYPLVYLGTFVLSENLAIPALTTAVFFIFQCLRKDKIKSAGCAGLFLAIASAARPNLAIMALPMAAALLLIPRFKKRHALRTAAFVVTLGGALLLVCVENAHISKGQLRGLSANAGINFFIQQCKIHEVASTFNGGSAFFHPAFVLLPELGRFSTDRPWSDQHYFFSLGVQCIQNHPQVLLQNISSLKNIFAGSFFPFHPQAAGVHSGIKIFSGFSALMLMGAFFALFSPSVPSSRYRELLFLNALVLINIPIFLVFPVEQRYLYPLYFIIDIAFFVALPTLWRNRKRLVILTALLLATLGASLGFEKFNQFRIKQIYGVSRLRIFTLAEAQRIHGEGESWNQWGNFIFSADKAVLFRSKTKVLADHFEMTADHNDTYVLDFFLGKKKLATLEVPPKIILQGGLSKRTGRLPARIRDQGFDAVLVRGKAGDGLYSIGHLLFSTGTSSKKPQSQFK